MLYAHKRFLGEVKVASEDGELVLQDSTLPIKKGERYLVDMFGNEFPLADHVFREYFVPVEEVKGTLAVPKRELSPFEEQYYRDAFAETSKLDSDESHLHETYINEQKLIKD